MQIEYSYQIVRVDEAARVMEVVYSATGRQTMHIGARLPYVGESLEDVVAMYSPVRYWEEQELTVVIPEVGTSGTLVSMPPPPPIIPEVVAAENQPDAAGVQTL